MRRRGEEGLTLVEVLVVLAIIGIAGSVTVIGFGGGGGGATAQAEARQLAAAIQQAADDALVTDRQLALDWDERGYAILAWDAARGEWRPQTAPGREERHELAQPFRLTANDAGNPARLDADTGEALAIGVSGGTEQWEVRFDGVTASVVAGGG